MRGLFAAVLNGRRRAQKLAADHRGDVLEALRGPLLEGQKPPAHPFASVFGLVLATGQLALGRSDGRDEGLPRRDRHLRFGDGAAHNAFLALEEEPHERPEITALRAPNRGQVARVAVASIDEEGKEPRADEIDARERARDAPITIFEGVNLVKGMMNPRRADLGQRARELMIDVNEPIHLGRDLLGRAIFVLRPVGQSHGVRPRLEGAAGERHLHPLPELIDGVGGLLMRAQERVKLFDPTHREIAAPPHDIHHHLERFPVILKDTNDLVCRPVRLTMRDERGDKALGYEHQRDAFGHVEDAFEHARLDAPPPRHLLPKWPPRAVLAQALPLALPKPFERAHLDELELIRIPRGLNGGPRVRAVVHGLDSIERAAARQPPRKPPVYEKCDRARNLAKSLCPLARTSREQRAGSGRRERKGPGPSSVPFKKLSSYEASSCNDGARSAHRSAPPR